MREQPFESALLRIRAGIQAHNRTHGVPESRLEGYHETLTHARLRLVGAMLEEYGPASTSEEFLDQHPELSQKKALRQFYSKEQITSKEANAHFVEPCLDAQDNNDDGTVDIADPVYSLSFNFSGGPPPLVPWPAGGLAPSTDSLDCLGTPTCP